MPEDAPRLSWSASVEDFLASCDDPSDAIVTLFSILADPDVDNRTKFDLDYFPYRGKRQLLDDSWHVVYDVDDDENVRVYTMRRRSDIDRLRQLLE